MQPPPASAIAEFVRALALGWKNLAAYPPGHPALAGSVETAHHRLSELRGPAGEVVFGVASDGLVYGEEKIEWTQAQKLANALYTRGVAIVRFGAETSPQELESFLRVLGTAPDEQRPIWELLTTIGVTNINLQPVDYSSVRVTDDLAIEPQKAESASLWEDILKALLAGKDITANARQLLSSIRSVDQLAALILRHVNDAGGDTEFDPDATFGVRILSHVPADSPDAATSRVAEAIGSHVANSSGLRRQLAVQQVVQLLRSLPDTLRAAIIQSVMETLASEESAGPQLRDFVSELKQDEVLDALRYLSSMGTLSSHAMRILQSLATPANASEAAIQPAPPALIAELVQLFGDEDIDRFNPPDHQSLLADMSVAVPLVPAGGPEALEQLRDRVDTVAEQTVNIQVARSLMELAGKFGGMRPSEKLLTRVEVIVHAQVGSGQFTEALEIVQWLREIAS
ncbi:MAG: hypothetical protein ACXW28_14440, partial [Thermoanaerobaculia bacterium]